MYNGSMGIFEGYGEYDDRKIDKEKTIDAIISLNPVFKRGYLETKTLDALHDLEESLIDTMY